MTLHTLDETADLLRCAKEQVRGLILDGELDAVPMGRGTQRRRWLVPDESLQRFIRRRIEAAKPTPRRKVKPVPAGTGRHLA